GRLARATAWAKTTTRSATAWAVDARGSHASVDVGFRAADRDRRVAAMVLAGGLAYRVFFWLVAVTFLLGGLLGLLDADGVESALADRGLGAWLAAAVAQFARSSDGQEWWLLLVGVWLVLWTGYSCTKALVLAHAAVWHIEPPKVARPFRAALIFNGLTFGFIAAMALARWLREENDAAGLGATLLVFVVPFAFWLVASHELPNRALDWRDLIPGATVVAVGLQAMHVFTVYFLERKLLNATELYGVIGVTTTILFWFYLAARLFVVAATLNASLAEHRVTQRVVSPG
ncbi:MAG TPA: YhjD/YihY/BrkB family envelope integrity protein, partial [Gaiellaceae bacterium]|nr:YhjD/YihY/BrkB family envelope integrity protein [Gaiellaceae bacterium]